MPKKNIRKAQIPLLRFEKTLEKQAYNYVSGRQICTKTIVTGATALTVAAGTASAQLASEKPTEFADKILEASHAASTQEGLLHLAEIVTKAHAEVEALAIKANFNFLFVDGGGTKGDPPMVKLLSIFGLG